MAYRPVSVHREVGDTSTKGEHIQAKDGGMAKAARDEKAVHELWCLQGKGPWSPVGSEQLRSPTHSHGGAYAWGLGCWDGQEALRGLPLPQKSVISDMQGLPRQVFCVLDFWEHAWEGSWASWVNCKSAGVSAAAL